MYVSLFPSDRQKLIPKVPQIKPFPKPHCSEGVLSATLSWSAWSSAWRVGLTGCGILASEEPSDHPQQLHQFIFPTAVYMRTASPLPLAFYVIFLLNDSHSDRCKIESQCSFYWHLPDGQGTFYKNILTGHLQFFFFITVKGNFNSIKFPILETIVLKIFYIFHIFYLYTNVML